MPNAFRTLCLFILASLTVPLQAEEKDKLIIFAAASLKDVVADQAKAWATIAGRKQPLVSVGASATMARQIAAGAPADVFLSAHPDWTGFLQEKGLLQNPPIIVARNSLVLVVPKNKVLPSSAPAPTQAYLSLLAAEGHIALADPVTAPAGAYAKKFLVAIGAWEKVAPSTAYGANVRQTLLLVERGGMAGFVYGTDAKKSTHVQILFTVPENLTDPILYTAAAVKNTPPDANQFIAFLATEDAARIWKAHGFLQNVSK